MSTVSTCLCCSLIFIKTCLSCIRYIYIVYIMLAVFVYVFLSPFLSSVLPPTSFLPLPSWLSAGWFLPCKPGPAQGFFLLKESFLLATLLTWGFRLWASASEKHLGTFLSRNRNETELNWRAELVSLYIWNMLMDNLCLFPGNGVRALALFPGWDNRRNHSSFYYNGRSGFFRSPSSGETPQRHWDLLQCRSLCHGSH